MGTCLLTIRRYNRDFIEVQVDDDSSVFIFQLTPRHTVEVFDKIRKALESLGFLPISESKEAKKAALLDKIMPRIKSVGHVCPMLEFRQECIVCDVVSEYDAIEKDGKP